MGLHLALTGVVSLLYLADVFFLLGLGIIPTSGRINCC